jgi:hypothetical protein
MATAIHTRLHIVGAAASCAVATSFAERCRAAGLSTRTFLQILLRSPFSIRASAMTCLSLAVLMCASAGVSPAVAQGPGYDRQLEARRWADAEAREMYAAIRKCDYDRWAGARRGYDKYSIVAKSNTPAPSYPIPCNPVSEGTNRWTTPTEPDKLYSVGRPLEPAKLYTVGTLFEPAKLYSVGTLGRPQPFNWSGFYIGVNGSGNFNTLGQTERFKMNNVVTNDFSDSSTAIGGGFSAGYLFAPWNNNIVVGPFASVDFPNQSTDHTVPGGFFLGQTTNVIGTVGAQGGVVAAQGVLIYGEFGAAFADIDQKLNFSGPATSVNKTVTGANLGIGAAFQPANWQIAGNPVAVVAQYNHVFLPRTTFDNPGSPLFLYSNQSDIDQFKIGVRVQFNPNLVAETPIRF